MTAHKANTGIREEKTDHKEEQLGCEERTPVHPGGSQETHCYGGQCSGSSKQWNLKSQYDPTSRLLNTHPKEMNSSMGISMWMLRSQGHYIQELKGRTRSHVHPGMQGQTKSAVHLSVCLLIIYLPIHCKISFNRPAKGRGHWYILQTAWVNPDDILLLRHSSH